MTSDSWLHFQRRRAWLRRVLAWLLVLSCLAAGCGKSEPAPETDPASLEKLDRQMHEARQQEKE